MLTVKKGPLSDPHLAPPIDRQKSFPVDPVGWSGKVEHIQKAMPNGSINFFFELSSSEQVLVDAASEGNEARVRSAFRVPINQILRIGATLQGPLGLSDA